MSKRVDDFRVSSFRRLTDDYFVLDLVSDKKLPPILPGQFVQVRADKSSETFLRRPISVYDTDYDNNIISLLIKEAGPGTRSMSQYSEGEYINLVYPLGNSFNLPSPGKEVLLIGGGVGVAPLYLLGRKLAEGNIPFKFLLGYQSAKDIIEPEKFSALAEVFFTSNDGTIGHKGLVTEHPVLEQDYFNWFYCCGPEPMMKSVASIASRRGIECEVSLENLMACGFGVCLCCTVETSDGNINSCTEGPVFNIKRLKWQI